MIGTCPAAARDARAARTGRHADTPCTPTPQGQAQGAATLEGGAPVRSRQRTWLIACRAGSP